MKLKLLLASLAFLLLLIPQGFGYYDPQSGRFLSPDPLGHEASFSLYDYGAGDPINFLDPDGRLATGFATGQGTSPAGKIGNLLGNVVEQMPGGNPARNVYSTYQDYSANYEITGSHWDASVQSFNPAYKAMSRGSEALEGLGMQHNNLGTELNGWQRAASGGMAVAHTVETVGIAYGGVKVGSTGISALRNSAAPKGGGSGWQNLAGGVRIKHTGNYWIKEVNPDASALAQWWGRGSLNAQARGLDKLGDMAPSHLFRNGKLITRDAGPYTPGNFWSTWAQGSHRLGTPFNDIRPHNIGSGGLIFDPAKHPIQQGLEAGAVGLGVGVGGLYLYNELNN